MRAVVFGATGMVGAGVLLECLDDPHVESVVAIGRSQTGRSHARLREIVHADFYSYEALRPVFATCDACFFCLGVTSIGLDEAQYTRLTYDLTVAAARAMVDANPGMTFCYVSGVGTDSTERGRTMWARVKGRTENAILAMPFKAAFMFRPGFIQPVRGVRSKAWYQPLYDLLQPVSPLLLRLAPHNITTTARIGRAMIAVTLRGYDRQILYNRDVNVIAAAMVPSAP